MQVDDAEERLALLLRLRVLAEPADVVAEVLVARRLDAREDPHHCPFRPLSRPKAASAALDRPRSLSRRGARRDSGDRCRTSVFSSRFGAERQSSGHYTRSHGRDRALDALLVARAARAAAAGVARPGRASTPSGSASGAAAARLRRRGAGAPRGARRGGRGPRVPAPGRRLRRVVPRRLGGRDPRAAQGAAADVRRPDVRRDAARRQGRPDRRAVREAAHRADRDGRRRRASVVPRPRDPLRRADARGARARPGADGAGATTRPSRRSTCCARSRRAASPTSRRCTPGTRSSSRARSRGALRGRSPTRSSARSAVHAGDRDRPRRRADAPRGRRLDEPRGASARLRGAARRAATRSTGRLVRLLGAHALDRRAHAAAGRRARRVLRPASTTRSA